jgi:hypothetical protein
MQPDWQELHAQALAEVKATLAALPVAFDRLPNRGLE